MENQTIALISDIHLDPNEVTRTELFKQFMTTAAESYSELYILGDLFEYWVGDDDFSGFANDICQTLLQFSQTGKPLYFMRGNRDFLVGRIFAKRTGAKILKDPTLIDVFGQKILLMHGDLLCSLDTEYLKTRRLYTHPVTKWIFNLLPLKTRTNMAEKLRKQSHEHAKQIDPIISDVYEPTVITYLEKYQPDALIHGHTHKPGAHQINCEGKSKSRNVLGSWHESGNVILLHNSNITPHFFGSATELSSL